MLLPAKQLLDHALRNGYALGAFNASTMEVLQGIVEAAAEQDAPLILQVTEGALEYAGLEYMVCLAKAAAQRNPELPMALHLDHAQSVETCKRAIDSGFTSVMIDKSALPFEENIAAVKEVVEYAHPKGVSVEAELGQIIGIEDALSQEKEVLTDPMRALEFVERTECDFLAVSIGTSHGAYKFEGEAKLDMRRLSQLHQIMPYTPLVLHGASSLPEEWVERAKLAGADVEGAKGVPMELLQEAVRGGICKINTDSDLRLAMLTAIREYMKEHPEDMDMRHYLGKGREAVKAMAAWKMQVLGSSGRASELML